MFIRIAIISYAVIWAILYPIYYTLQKVVSRLFSQCFIVGLYVVAFLGYGVLYHGMKSPDSVAEYILHHQTFIIVFSGCLASSSWLFIHYLYFQVPSPELERFLIKSAKKLLRKPNFVIESKENIVPDSRLKRAMMIMYFISSMIIGASYICLEMFFTESIILSAQNSRLESLFMYVYLLLGLPLFFLLGLPIAANTTASPKNRMLILPIIILLPVIGCVLISQNFIIPNYGTNIAIYLICGPPVALFYWLFMTMIYIYNRRVFYLVLLLTFFFFWIPIFVLKPIQDTSLYDISSLLSDLIYLLIG